MDATEDICILLPDSAVLRASLFRFLLYGDGRRVCRQILQY